VPPLFSRFHQDLVFVLAQGAAPKSAGRFQNSADGTPGTFPGLGGLGAGNATWPLVQTLQAPFGRPRLSAGGGPGRGH